ncbi:MAG: hypothetical protein FJW92_03620 [Actinobacteria bacterium]|nr:hypothetical protein [Actinomycetota bacterium]
MISPARVITLVLAIVALAVGAAGCGSGEPAASRSAAGAGEDPLPTAAFITTGGTDGPINPELVRCALPEGPCREIAEMGSD